jgi:hypothetical protein
MGYASIRDASAAANLSPHATLVAGGPVQYALPLILGVLKDSKELIKVLESRHPNYEAHCRDYWQYCADLALDRLSSMESRRRYLVKGVGEHPNLFTLRVALSQYLPETPKLVNDFLSSVFGQPITRDVPDNLQPVVDKATTSGMPLAVFAERMARMALTYGVIDVLADYPSADEGGDDRPYLSIYTPDTRLDWKVDELGKIAFVKYKQSERIKESWVSKDEVVDVYRIITPEKIWQFRVFADRGRDVQIRLKSGEWADCNKKLKVDTTNMDNFGVPHDFERVPVIPIYGMERLEEMVGYPWVLPLVNADLKTFRQESDQEYDRYTHMHPTWKYWKHKIKGKALDAMLSTSNFVPLDPGDKDKPKEDVEIVKMETGGMAVMRDMIADTRAMTKRFTGNENPLLDKQKLRDVSGVSMAYTEAATAKNFKRLSEIMKAAEIEILTLIGAEMGENEESLKKEINIVYPSMFDQRSSDELRFDYYTALEIGQDDLIRVVEKRLANKMAGSVDRELREKIMTGIETKPIAKPEEMTGVVGNAGKQQHSALDSRKKQGGSK